MKVRIKFFQSRKYKQVKSKNWACSNGDDRYHDEQLKEGEMVYRVFQTWVHEAASDDEVDVLWEIRSVEESRL